jgi:hypothetical protein
LSESQPLSQQEKTQVIPLIDLDYPRFALDLDGIWIDLDGIWIDLDGIWIDLDGIWIVLDGIWIDPDGIWIDRAPLDAAGRTLLVGRRLHFHPHYCRRPSQHAAHLAHLRGLPLDDG